MAPTCTLHTQRKGEAPHSTCNVLWDGVCLETRTVSWTPLLPWVHLARHRLVSSVRDGC